MQSEAPALIKNPRTGKPSYWKLLQADLAPSQERWQHALKLSLAGGLIIAVQQTLRFEMMYPGMTILLVVNELKGFGNLTRFLLNFFAATFGCALAVVASALFLQQPMFYLPFMWGFIIVVMYFIVSSRYRSSVFVCGYPFIVITYMVLFDKDNAEHIAIVVYQSVITGLTCASLVMAFLWPLAPLNVLRAKLIACARRSLELLERIRNDLSGRDPPGANPVVPEHFRMQTNDMVMALNNAQTDLSFDDRARHDLISLMAFQSRTSASLSMVDEEVILHHGHAAPADFQLIDALKIRLNRIMDRLKEPTIPGDDGAPTTGPELPSAPTSRWLEPMRMMAGEADLVAPKVGIFARLKDQPDFATQTVRNLGQCLPNLFRLPVRKPNISALKHAVKCASAIMMCAIFCIAMNWDKGIGCVETVMLVVQATFGATLFIGGLRVAGVVMGFTLSIFAVIFIMPIITTIPGFLLLFMVMLFVMGYAIHGAPRINVPALQTMIVFDFSLLQLNRPDISLYPTMNFSLAVLMGVFVTFLVYRLLWPVRARDELLPCLAGAMESIAGIVDLAATKPLTVAQCDDARLAFDEEVANFLSFHNFLQLEEHCDARCCELQLRALTMAENVCDDILNKLSPRAGEPPTLLHAGVHARILAANVRRCASALRGSREIQLEPMPSSIEGDPDIARWMRGLNSDLENALEVFASLRAMPLNSPTLMGLA